MTRRYILTTIVPVLLVEAVLLIGFMWALFSWRMPCSLPDCCVDGRPSADGTRCVR